MSNIGPMSEFYNFSLLRRTFGGVAEPEHSESTGKKEEKRYDTSKIRIYCRLRV